MAARETYARLALEQMPRLLGNLDRNPYSPTYGCFHRDYWLDKTSDFPDAVRQFAVQALAIAWRHPLPGSIYHRQPKLLAWTAAGLDFWCRIQHQDGSFDEFYPYERGWVGPTAFTTFTTIEALRLVEEALDPALARRVREAVYRAARFICQGDREEDHLANHHAMACLAVWKAYRLLGAEELLAGYRRLWRGFMAYHHPEGWSREYDGVDPGYLSATVSFLGKIYQEYRDPELKEVLAASVEMCSYFVYPNRHYAGSLGSRNTLHFYPHGFEVLAPELPLAAAVAEEMLAGLEEGALVPPAIMADRYLAYRVCEYLQCYLDYSPRPARMPPVPCRREPFARHFPAAGVWVRRDPDRYAIANLAKGGVLKVFDDQGRLLVNDCGLLGRLEDGRVITSQWIDPTYRVQADGEGWQVEGEMHQVVAGRLFTPLKNVVFRLVLATLGRIPAFCHWLKGRIRRKLILNQPVVPVRFRRRLRLREDGALVLEDEVRLQEGVRLASLRLGDEFFVRYVPQSMYFQPQELQAAGDELSPEEIARLNAQGVYRRETVVAGGGGGDRAAHREDEP